MKVINGDNIELLKEYPDNCFDSIVTDAPYGLGKEPNAKELMKDWIEKGYHEISGSGFMGKQWDAFVPQPIFWQEIFRVLKPGGHILAFYGTRTYDWGVMAMRFAGFEVRDCPIKILDQQSGESNSIKSMRGEGGGGDKVQQLNYRENSLRGHTDKGGASRFFQQCNFEQNDIVRFQYTSKASKSEKNKGLDMFEEKRPDERSKSGMGSFDEKGVAKQSNFHPTVKPVKLMQYLVRLVTPPNGIVLDPFCGSGTTGIACKLEGFYFIGLEQDAEYCKIAQARIDNYVDEEKSSKSKENESDNKFKQQTLF